MVEEVTRDFLDWLFSRYEEIIATEPWEIASTIAFLAGDYSSYLAGEIISASSQRAHVWRRECRPYASVFEMNRLLAWYAPR